MGIGNRADADVASASKLRRNDCMLVTITFLGVVLSSIAKEQERLKINANFLNRGGAAKPLL